MEISLESAISSRRLLFTNRDGEFFNLELLGNPSTSIRVSTYTDDNGLNNLFTRIGSLSRPWKGTLNWESLEGELAIKVSCSSLGQVNFEISILELAGHPEGSRLDIGLQTEFGQLAELAIQSKLFFSVGST